MSLRSLAFVVATAGAITVPAVAEAAYTTGSVNMRYGPGTNYQVITTLPPGAYVAVSRCSGGWCLVNAVGTSGWVSASYVSGGRAYYAYPPPPPPPRRYYYAPVYPRAVYPAYPYRYAYPYPRHRYYGGSGAYLSGPGYGFYFNFGPGRHHW
jgi:hypothetical protein